MLKTILKTSWTTIWHNPVLWIFGLFSTILTGNEISFIINNLTNYSLDFYSVVNKSLLSLSHLNSTPVSWGFLIVILFFAVLLCLAVLGQIGLIAGLEQQINGRKPSFSQSLKPAKKYFGLIFGINLILIIVVYVFFAAIRLPFTKLFAQSPQSSWLLVYFLLNLLLVLPLSLIAYFWARFIIIDLILNKNTFKNSLQSAWKFLFKNWLSILGFMVVLGLIGVVFGLIIFILSSTVATPFILLTAVFSYFKIRFSLSVIFSLIVFIISLVFLFLESIFLSFHSTAWTMFYLGKRSE